MKQILIVIGALALVGIIAGCSAPPAPTAVPPASSSASSSAVSSSVAPAATKASSSSSAASSSAASSAASSSAASGLAETFEITLTATNMRPQEITVKVGEKVHFVLTNVDKTEEHNLVSAKAKIREILVPPKSTVEADWVAPTTPGDFEVPCSIHREIIPLTIHVVP